MIQSTVPGPLERVPTHVPRLDLILKGGLLRGGTYAVMGPPGSGKTVLGCQIAFRHVATGGKAVFVTLLAESHTRMLANLRGMAFFDDSVIPEKLLFVNGFGVLEREGISGLQETLRRTVRDHRATLLVIDGLETAESYAESRLAYQRFLRELQTYTSVLGCTVLLLTPLTGERVHSENTLVDGVLELGLRLLGPRAVRELTVHKFRGSEYLLGQHEVEITGRGIVVHPRTEVMFDSPPEEAAEARIRMPFGIPSLDGMFRGGLLSGSTTTLLGAPGTGKTVLGLQFLSHGASLGQPGVYFGFYETPPRLIEKAESVGIPLRKAVESGLVEIQWQPPLEHNLDSLAERLIERIRERKVKHLRLFVDGVAGFRGAAAYETRLPRFFAALTHELRALDATTIFSEEAGLLQAEIDTMSGMGSLVDNIVLLRYVELRSQLYRLISILKMRESDYDTAIRQFTVTAEGLRVADSFESAEAILSGQARLARDAGAVSLKVPKVGGLETRERKTRATARPKAAPKPRVKAESKSRAKAEPKSKTSRKASGGKKSVSTTTRSPAGTRRARTTRRRT